MKKFLQSDWPMAIVIGIEVIASFVDRTKGDIESSHYHFILACLFMVFVKIDRLQK